MTQPPLPPLSRRGAMLAATLGLFVAGRPALADDTASTVIEAFYATLLDTMKKGPELHFKGRFDTLRPAFEKAFNVTFMTQFVVGSAWVGLGDDEKAKVTGAFTDFSVAFYAHNFASFDGESFAIDGTRDTSQGTLVSTRIVPKGDQPVPMNYLLRKGDRGWQVIDVFLDGTISQLATRRTDFAQTLREKGVPGLVDLLEGKMKELAGS